MPNTSAPRGLASQQSESIDGPNQRRLFHLVKRLHARVEILTGEILLLPYEKSSTLLDLFTETCKYCSVAEQDYFGLAVRESGSEWYQFVDLSKKVSKFERKKRLIPKAVSQENCNGSSHANANGNVSSSSVSSTSASGAPLFHFRLAYYVPCHVLPRDRGTKRQYYLQLRRNLREFSLLQTDEQIVSLVLYALQADYGSFGSHLLTPSDSTASHVVANSNVAGGERYFEPARYFPRWMLDKFGEAYFLTHVPPLHAGLKTMSRSEAEFHFIRECSSLAATSYNMHLYRLQRLNSVSGWLSAASSLLNVSLRGSSKVRRSASAKRVDSSTSSSVTGATPSSTRTPVSMTTTDSAATNMWLGISPNGLELFERAMVDSVGYRSHVSSIAWNEIGKLRFKKTRLEVRVLVDNGGKKQQSGAAEAPSRRPVSASFLMQDLQLAPEAVSQSVQPRRSLLNTSANANAAAQPTPNVERVLVFCTDSTAQSAQILELTKLQHVFQLKASLRAPQTADAIELAERARYRESLISTASIRDRANRVRADAEAARRMHNDRTSQRVCVSVNLDALNQSLPPPPPPPPQSQTQAAQHVRSGRRRTSTSPRMSNRRSMHEPITAAAVTQPTAINISAPPVCVDVAPRRRSQSPISMSTVTTASSTTTPNTVIEQRSAASISLTASPVSLCTQPRRDMLTLAEPDCEAAPKAVRAASEDESGLGTLEPEHGSDSPASDAERAAIAIELQIAHARDLAIDAPICADSASPLPPASDGQAVRSSRKMDGSRNSQPFASLNDDTLTASSALKSWKSLNEQLNLTTTNSQAEA